MGPAGKALSVVGSRTEIAGRAWDRLASEHIVDRNLLPPDIALSWERCVRNNVDSLESRNITIRADWTERAERLRELLQVAKVHMQNLYETVKGMGFIVLLTDPEGVVLEIFGDREMRRLSESVSLVHGASCSEEVIGTTSPGVCLVRKSPVQVLAREHYCRLYHNWCCTAAPIFDNEGGLVAVLDLSGTDAKIHTPVLLGLVSAAARAIELELKLRRMGDDFKRSQVCFNMIVDSVPEALVFFDEHGTMTRMNRAAARVVGGIHAAGGVSPVEAAVSDFKHVEEKLEAGRGWAEVVFKTPGGPIRMEAFLKSLGDDDQHKAGVVATLKEAKRSTIEGTAAVYSFEDLIYRSRKMDDMVRNARRASSGDITILIQGESGTGKELLAHAIHNQSPRRKAPFVPVNCAALPRELIQSELFGYEEGAFTGARRGGKAGRLELANGGTIFLDEVGDMPLSVQANLLRVLQDRQVVRVGGGRPIQLDVRVTAATNRDLEAELELGSFRRDLFYRLAVMTVHIPPLRERKEDIQVLLRHFVRKHAPRWKDPERVRLDRQVVKTLAAYDWPGNARELENTVVFFLNKMTGNTVTLKDIPPAVFGQCGQNVPVRMRTLDEAEKETICETLAHCNSNVSLAAGILGITRATLYHKIAKYGIELRN